jgi:hypothetical protein
MRDPFWQKIKFAERFKRRHALRLHMSLILLTTVGAGLLATRIMLALHLNNVMIRYPLSVVFAYLVFFVSVKLWLKFVAASYLVRKTHDTSPNLFDVVPDLSTSGPSGGHIRVGEVFRGGGGNFGGGGVSGSFVEAGAAVTDSAPEVVAGSIDTAAGLGDAAADVAGEAVSGLGDDGGFVALVVFAVLAAIMAIFVGAGIYLVYEAPFILSEAAFEFILAAGLVRETRKIEATDWVGSVFRATWIPFAVTLASALLAGFLIHHFFPQVTRLSELLSLF